MEILSDAGTWQTPAPGATNYWVQHLRVADLSVGTYCLPAGGVDDQTPHTEDEIYVITAGQGTIVTDTGRAQVGPGAVIYVPAGEAHRFVDITEDLAVLVIFAPAYRSRRASSQ